MVYITMEEYKCDTNKTGYYLNEYRDFDGAIESLGEIKPSTPNEAEELNSILLDARRERANLEWALGKIDCSECKKCPLYEHISQLQANLDKKFY